MNDLDKPEFSTEDPELQVLYTNAIPRMLRMMIIAAAGLLLPFFWIYGWAGMLGFGAGCAIACLNFRLLVQGVEGLADRVVNRDSRERGRTIVLRFLIRYGLVALVAYAIFRSSPRGFRGFLWGLCLPVVAMMIEAGVEACIAFRK